MLRHDAGHVEGGHDASSAPAANDIGGGRPACARDFPQRGWSVRAICTAIAPARLTARTRSDVQRSPGWTSGACRRRRRASRRRAWWTYLRQIPRRLPARRPRCWPRAQSSSTARCSAMSRRRTSSSCACRCRRSGTRSSTSRRAPGSAVPSRGTPATRRSPAGTRR